MECPTCSSQIGNSARFCPRCGCAVLPEGTFDDSEFRYEAFISYRHIPRDRTVARKLQRAIEGFRIPQKARQGNTVRLGKCFRDEDELPTSASLPESIEDALAHSRFLIVVCSPQMRESLWCAREIETFSELRGRNNVVLALAEGEPDEAFPLLLQTISKVDGSGNVVQELYEPVAADFRKSAHKKFSDEALRVIAALVNCGYDDLKQRTRTRTARRISALAIGVAAASIAFGSFSLFQQSQIQTNLENSLLRQSQLQAEQSADVLGEGKRAQAAAIALDALGQGEGSTSRPYIPEARLALERAVNPYPCASGLKVKCAIEEEGHVEDTVVSQDGSRYVVLDSFGNINIYDTDGSKKVAWIDSAAYGSSGLSEVTGKLATAGDAFIFQTDSKVVAVNFSDGSTKWDSDKDSLEKDLHAKSDSSTLFTFDEILPVDSGNSIVLVGNGTGATWFYAQLNTRDGSLVRTYVGEVPEGAAFEAQAIDTQGSDSFFLVGDTYLMRIGPDGTTSQALFNPRGEVGNSGIIGGGGLVAVCALDDAHLTVQAFDAETLDQRWTYESDKPNGYESSLLGFCQLTSGIDTVAVSLSNTILYLDRETGALVDSNSCSATPIAIANTIAPATTGSNSTNGEERQAAILVLASGKLCCHALNGDFSDSFFESSASLNLESEIAAAKIFHRPDGTPQVLVMYSTGDNSRYTCLVSAQDTNLASSYNSAPATKLRSSPESRSSGGTYLAATGTAQDSSGSQLVELIDGDSFESLRTWSCQELSLKRIERASFSSKRDEVLYVQGKSTDGKDCIVALDAGSGSIRGLLESVSLPTATGINRTIKERPDGTLAFLSNDSHKPLSVIVADAETLGVISETKVSSDEGLASGSATTVVALGDCILSKVFVGSSAAWFTIDANACTASRLDANIGIAEQNSRLLLDVNGSGEICAICDDGKMRCLSPNGSIKWETDQEAGELCAFTFLPNGDLVLEDSTGTLHLVDGKTGLVVASDLRNTLVKSFISKDMDITCSYDEADSRLYIYCNSQLIGIQTKRDSFGIESCVVGGRIPSRNFDKVIWDYWGRYLVPMPSDGGLIEQGKTLVAEHPLTESEKTLYGLP